MLPRRVIIEHGLDVLECLLLRKLGEDAIRAVNAVHNLGPTLGRLVQRRDELRAEKNLISGQFKGATAAEKLTLRDRSKEVAAEIAHHERETSELQATIERYEALIPNVPELDVPLPSHLTEEEVAWKRLLLRRIHRLIAEENE